MVKHKRTAFHHEEGRCRAVPLEETPATAQPWDPEQTGFLWMVPVLVLHDTAVPASGEDGGSHLTHREWSLALCRCPVQGCPWDMLPTPYTFPSEEVLGLAEISSSMTETQGRFCSSIREKIQQPKKPKLSCSHLVSLLSKTLAPLRSAIGFGQLPSHCEMGHPLKTPNSTPKSNPSEDLLGLVSAPGTSKAQPLLCLSRRLPYWTNDHENKNIGSTCALHMRAPVCTGVYAAAH